MIIKRTNTYCKDDFYLDGHFHSREVNKSLTDLVEDLNVSVSSYIAKNEKGDMVYMDIWLNEDPSKFFWLGNFDSLGERNDTDFHGWGIHFKTWGNVFERMCPDTVSALTEEQKDRLFEATARLIPKGALLSTYGTITKGGVSGILRFRKLGFKRAGIAYPKDYYDETKTVAIPIWKKI